MRRVQKMGQRSVVVKIARCVWPVAAGVALCQPASLNAAPPATWEGTLNAGGDNSLWTNVDNWTTNGVADVRPTNTAPGDDITIGNDVPTTISLNGNELADSLTFTANYTLDAPLATNTLTIYTGSISVGSGVSATINSILAGNSGLKLSGGGTLTLTASQSYTGSAAINSGTVILNNAHALYTGNPLTIASSGAVDFDASMVFASSITNSGTVTITGGDQVSFSTSSALFTQSAGSLNVQGTLNTGGVGFSYNGGTVSGTVQMGSTTNQPNLTLGSSAGNSGTFIIGGEGAALTAINVQSNQTIDFIPTDTVTTDSLSDSFSFANAGTINVEGSTTTLATLTAGSNTITNTGTISTSNSSTISTTSVLAYIGGVVNNTTGTVTIGASTKMTGNVTNGGLFNVSAGSVTFGGNFTNTGTLDIGSGQTLNYSATNLTFTQEGQVNVAAGGTLDLSKNQANLYRGSITLTAGTTPAVLKLSSVQFGGANSTSSMTISSTAVLSAGYVDLGGAAVTFNIGSASPAEDFIVSAPITDGGVTKTGAGTLVLSGDNTYALATTVSAGTLQVGAADAIPSTGGGITLQTTGVMQFATGIGGVTTTSLSIGSTSDLDITNNHLFITYQPGNDPIDSIAALIATGYNGGAWNGAGGIISTTAQTNSGSYGIGYADSATLGSLPTNTIEIAYTLLGDANLDGKVNGEDFTLMASNFNDSVTAGWDEGDFNYSNSVNGEDFVLLADNFNQFASQSAVSTSDLAALDSFAAANGISLTSVPEPTCGAVALIGTIGLLQTRARSRKRGGG